jgi:hypothetical protein
LNRKGIPAPRGGRWHLTTVVRTLTRLGLIRVGKGRSNQRLAVKKAADARARALASTVRKLRKAGFVSVSGHHARVEQTTGADGTGRQMASKQH